MAFFLSYRSLQKQKRLNQLKNDFISNVTHELKTPITTVGVAIEALRNFNALQDPAKTEEYLAISKQELNRLSILVDRVLKMSLFDQQEPELKIESLDLQQLSEGILRSMKLQFEKYGAVVETTFEGEDFDLEGDRGHLTSVLYNLIDNALKYGGDTPQIQLFIQEKEGQIEIQVMDRGIGIPNAYQDRIFEKFFRVPSGDRHNIKGHGLGLSYVSSVIAQHQGTIDFDSTEGKGTTFTIQLPRKHG
ncbi:MAG: HAMP domain-containing sensor histidine kinase [Bacteroidota bacterium]